MPNSLKGAYVRSVLKKQSLNKAVLNNYRPVWNLPYLSKTIEHVALRLSAYMSEHNPSPPTSPTTVLRRPLSVYSMNKHSIVIIVLLDLPAAFDTMDHKRMLQKLSQDVGVVQQALKWFMSYLSDGSIRPHPGSYITYLGLNCSPSIPVAKIIRKNNLMSHF